MYLYYKLSIILIIIILFIIFFLKKQNENNIQIGGAGNVNFTYVKLDTLDYNNAIFGEITNLDINTNYDINISFETNNKINFYFDITDNTKTYLRILPDAINNNSKNYYIKLTNISQKSTNSLYINNLKDYNYKTLYIKITPIEEQDYTSKNYSPLIINNLNFKISQTVNLANNAINANNANNANKGQQSLNVKNLQNTQKSSTNIFKPFTNKLMYYMGLTSNKNECVVPGKNSSEVVVLNEVKFMNAGSVILFLITIIMCLLTGLSKYSDEDTENIKLIEAKSLTDKERIFAKKAEYKRKLERTKQLIREKKEQELELSRKLISLTKKDDKTALGTRKYSDFQLE
jgi:hypothetical protein